MARGGEEAQGRAIDRLLGEGGGDSSTASCSRGSESDGAAVPPTGWRDTWQRQLGLGFVDRDVSLSSVGDTDTWV
ncbi:hypothetical protein M6B38_162875 [Iris pallida]|uniref:Uncharacterized protein n=1 Tax=Iris pallida TaxID=29817 RepID=A0AAX6F0P4_IRIPA|nr:hypothetical protein M6B38_162875 [Iris pallida]